MMASRSVWPVTRRSWRQSGWAVEAATAVGRVRPRQEDAWQVGFGWRLAGRRADVFAVFDGLGGEPNGDRASRAAADELQDAMAAASGPASLLGGLNQRVLGSRGMTTAVIAAFLHGGAGHLFTVGDSSAFGLVGGRPALLAPHDVEAGSGRTGDQLGAHFRAGHAMPLSLDRGGSILLCTDGVDAVVNAPALRLALEASPSTMAGVVDRLVDDVHARGAPDNATLILARYG